MQMSLSIRSGTLWHTLLKVIIYRSEISPAYIIVTVSVDRAAYFGDRTQFVWRTESGEMIEAVSVIRIWIVIATRAHRAIYGFAFP